MLTISLFFISGIYALLMFTLIIIWLKNDEIIPHKKEYLSSETIKISVIIPVRNEAANIRILLEDLEKQTLPKNIFEVIVADDESTDETANIVRAYQTHTKLNLILNKLPSKINNTSPKKRAINSSIKIAKGNLIATTDGDCRVGEQWLATILNFQQQTAAYLISSPVTFTNRGKGLSAMINAMQTIEFASLVGSGACAMFIEKPNMCNGANICYLKSVFHEVEGFKGNEDLASGDDEFLMHKIAQKYPSKVKFLKNKEAIVATYAPETWRFFYNQRKRWASKWQRYDNWQTSALAVFIFLANLCIPISLVAFAFHQISIVSLFIIISLKCIFEFCFLSLVIGFLKKINYLPFIFLVQIIYPLYVVFFGLIAQKKSSYQWKERSLH